MKNKCTKFESFFTFRTEEELLAHINECEDCKKEYEKFKKISYLIQEVKPYYIKKQNNLRLLKIACTVLFMAFSGFALGFVSTNTDITDTIKYGASLSAEDLGFPVDSYGLIAVE